jgi:hypothetical protein
MLILFPIFRQKVYDEILGDEIEKRETTYISRNSISGNGGEGIRERPLTSRQLIWYKTGNVWKKTF